MAININRAIASCKRWQGDNNNRRIFVAAVSVGLVSLVVKATFFIKEIIVAYQFGRGDVLDAYLIAYALPAFLINVFASIYASAFVPLFLRVWRLRGRDQAQKLFSGTVSLNLALFTFVCVLLWIFGVPVVKFLGSGFSSEKLVLTHELFMLLVPSTILAGLAANVGAILNANEKFYAPALSPLFTSVSITLALLAFGQTLGVYALAAGTLIGLLLELIYLWLKASRLDWRLFPAWKWHPEDRRQLLGQVVPLAGGVLLMCSFDLIDSAMASMLGSGNVSAFSYGTRVSLATMGIASVVLGTVVLPRFSQLVATGAWEEIKKILRTYNRLIIIICIPLIVMVALYSEQIVATIYQRGAFTSDDTRLVSQVQALHILQLPFYLMGILGGKVISAIGKNQWLLAIAIVSAALNIIGNYVFMKIFGVAGIALATTIVIFLSWVMIQRVVSRCIDQNLRLSKSI